MSKLDEEQYLLICLMEECAEVAQRASKALRFGMTEVQAGQGQDNAERITVEINDLKTVISLLESRGSLPSSGNELAHARKVDKIERYMAYAREVGTLG